MWNFGFSRAVHCISGQLLQLCLAALKVWELCPGCYLDPSGSILLAQVTWAVAGSVLSAVVAYHWLPAGEGGWWATSALSSPSPFSFSFLFGQKKAEQTLPVADSMEMLCFLTHFSFIYLFYSSLGHSLSKPPFLQLPWRNFSGIHILDQDSDTNSYTGADIRVRRTLSLTLGGCSLLSFASFS